MQLNAPQGCAARGEEVYVKSEYVIYISNALLSNDWRVAPPKEGKPPGFLVSHTDIIPCLIKSFIKPFIIPVV